MPRRIAVPLALCALAVSPGLAVAGASAAPAPHAKTAATCGKTNLTSLKGGYIYMVTTRGLSCKAAHAIEVSYQNCRLKSGVSGRCHAKQSGLTCTEKRQSDPTTLIGIVTCKHASKSVGFTYLQDF